ncbi:MAG: hypothetical protein V1755_15270 [Chloroflexota bacterium]
MNAATHAIDVRRSAWLLGAILFLGSAYFYQDPEWNGNSRLNLTRAIVEQGTLRIDAYHSAPGWSTGDKAFYEGHYYSDKAIGASLLAVPIYYVFRLGSSALGMDLTGTALKHVLTTGVMGAMFAMSGLSMYFIALRIAARPWRAVLPTLALAFGTMLWPYSAVFYGHLPAAAFLSVAFAILFGPCQLTQPVSRAAWFWVGISVSMAFLSDYTSAPVIVGLAVYALYALRNLDFGAKVHGAWTMLAGLLIPLLVLYAYNMAVYGRPLAFGYAYEVEERFQEIMGLGLMGMRLPTIGASYHITFDPRFGLFWLSPVLLLAPIGYAAAFKDRRYRAESLLSVYAIVAVFAMNAASYLWYGGSAFGPRLLVSALPFFIVPLALLPTAWVWPLVTMGLMSTLNMLIPLVGEIQYARLEFKPGRGGFFVAGAPFRGFSLLYDYGLPQVWRLAQSGRSPWTLGSALGFPLWLSVVALLAVESALVLAFHRLTVQNRPST